MRNRGTQIGTHQQQEARVLALYREDLKLPRLQLMTEKSSGMAAGCGRKTGDGNSGSEIAGAYLGPLTTAPPVSSLRRCSPNEQISCTPCITLEMFVRYDVDEDKLEESLQTPTMEGAAMKEHQQIQSHGFPGRDVVPCRQHGVLWVWSWALGAPEKRGTTPGGRQTSSDPQGLEPWPRRLLHAGRDEALSRTCHGVV